MADFEVQAKWGADTHELVTAKTALRDIVAEQEQFEASSANMTAATADAEQGMGKLNLATAGVSRELVVLGREVMTGNFSRIPGSILTLESRMGGLNLATIGATAAIGGTAFALYELVSSANEAAGEMNRLDVALQATGKSGVISGADLEKQVEQLEHLPGVTRAMAESVVEEFTRAHDIGGEMISKLTNVVGDFAAATGEKMPQAAKTLATAFENPAKGALELQKIFNDQLNPSIINHIIKEAQLGETVKAQTDLWDLLSQHVKGAEEDSLSPLETLITKIEGGFRKAKQAVEDFYNFPTKLMQDMDPGQLEDSGEEKAAAAKAEATAKNNTQLERALDLSRSITGETTKLASLQNTLAELKLGENKGTSADRSQIVAAEKDIQEKIANLRDINVQKKASTYALERQMDAQYYSQQADMVRDSATEGEITYQQEYKQLELSKELEMEANQRSYDNQLKLYHQDSTNYSRVLNEKRLAYQKFQSDIAKLQRQETIENQKELKKQQTDWMHNLQPIESSFKTSIAGMVEGTMTLRQAFQNMTKSMISALIDYVLKAGEEWALSELLGTASASGQATAAIGAYAATAGAGAYAAIAAIPFVGPFIAPPIAAATYAAAMSYEGLAQLDVGAWDIPKDGPAYLHAGESVVPKDFASGLRDNGGFGGGGGDTHVHFHVAAMDDKSVSNFFDRHGDKIAKTVASQGRNGNKAVRSSIPRN